VVVDRRSIVRYVHEVVKYGRAPTQYDRVGGRPRRKKKGFGM